MNIQQTIIRAIGRSLYAHDFVVLPGFGGFVLKKQAAHYSPARGSLVPPAKTVGFNSQLRQSDGILQQMLVKELNCQNAEATAHLEAFSDYCRSVLQAKRRLALPGIGFFYLDFENNTCFEPQHDANFLASSFGLGPVTIQPLAATEKQPVSRQSAPIKSAGKTLSPVIIRRRALVTTGIAAAVLIVALSIISLLPVSGELRASFLNASSASTYSPVDYSFPESHTPVSPEAPLVADAMGVAWLSMGELRLPVNTGKPVIAEAVAAVNTVANGEFEIIIGCFANPRNADKLVRAVRKELPSAAVSTTKVRGLRAVSAGRYATRDEAQAVASQIQAIAPGAWVYPPL